ncbi:MAG: spermidine/putrescine ABC transporter substrate-binding protein [Legionella sp.]|nr:spermidine/putrescine ABC transporter substrate-binding protein [Legionella sp.]
MNIVYGILLYLITLVSANVACAKSVVNVYAWGGEIPKVVLKQFEKETGIKVNFSTYDNNETLYAKLRATNNGMYDVILPSSYFVERMKAQSLLLPLDSRQLPNKVNLDKFFVNNTYDEDNKYSIPLIWGVTGLFYNREQVKLAPSAWQDLWQERWHSALMLLDDAREVFSVALMSLGWSPNDADKVHIEAAYRHLLALIPNIKLFASESIQAIMIDEDAIAGIAWNGDVFKARLENRTIDFVYPKEGFIIWVDCLAIPKNPPHMKEAYQFINFMLKPETGKMIALTQGHAIANAASKALLPAAIQNNPMIYPSNEVLSRGHFQRNVSDETLNLYAKYWQQFKLAL